MSSPRENKNLKGTGNLETVIKKYKNAIGKLEIERINKIKKLNELEIKKRIRGIKNKKINE